MERFQQFLDFIWTTPTLPPTFTAWEFFNSNLLLAVVGAAFTWVFQSESRKQRKNQEQELANQVLSSREEDEKDDAKLSDLDNKPNLKAASQIIRTLKDGIDARADKENKLYKKTYDKMSRYDYLPLIEAMRMRNFKYDSDTADMLMEAFEKYKPFKSGRNEVPDEIRKRLEHIERKLRRRGFFDPTKRLGARGRHEQNENEPA